MTSPPWMPLYIGDFIADTMHLNATETGMYVRLLLHCWQHTVIPRDDRQLAMIAHCDARQWRRHRDAVLAFFSVMDVTTMSHARVTRELRRSLEISSKRKAATRSNAKQMPAHSQSSKKSLSFSVTRQSAKPPKAAADEASKGHPLRASNSLVRIVHRKARSA
jgi:uncharacterized protein YdaU (DUF1376 family)